MTTVSEQSDPNGRGRGRYFTLALLLAWVIGVFVYTVLKFSGAVA